MAVNLLPAAAMGFAAITSGIAIYQWRRAAGLYSLLVEGANRYEELRQRGTSLEQLSKQHEDQFRKQSEANKRINQSLDEARAQTATLTQRLEQKTHEIHVVTEKLELQKKHLERQLAKAEEQTTIAEQQRLDAVARLTASERQLSELQRTSREEKSTLQQELSLRDKDWQARLYEAEKAKVSAEKAAKSGDPVELKRYKRKVAQYDRLYASMKGLRELSEERNRNWEVALSKLSLWILEEKGITPIPKAIGPLVGTALQSIGAQLITDIEGDEREGGASHIHEIPDPLEAEDPTDHVEG
ncbi:MAG: hypothetical protein FJ146_10135 [Deltaproteobacteria bacterium]|nr:hypothetical protein [Deltaproteobacteria bacterium]